MDGAWLVVPWCVGAAFFLPLYAWRHHYMYWLPPPLPYALPASRLYGWLPSHSPSSIASVWLSFLPATNASAAFRLRATFTTAPPLCLCRKHPLRRDVKLPSLRTALLPRGGAAGGLCRALHLTALHCHSTTTRIPPSYLNASRRRQHCCKRLLPATHTLLRTAIYRCLPYSVYLPPLPLYAAATT